MIIALLSQECHLGTMHSGSERKLLESAVWKVNSVSAAIAYVDSGSPQCHITIGNGSSARDKNTSMQARLR